MSDHCLPQDPRSKIHWTLSCITPYFRLTSKSPQETAVLNNYQEFMHHPQRDVSRAVMLPSRFRGSALMMPDLLLLTGTLTTVTPEIQSRQHWNIKHYILHALTPPSSMLWRSSSRQCLIFVSRVVKITAQCTPDFSFHSS